MKRPIRCPLEGLPHSDPGTQPPTLWFYQPLYLRVLQLHLANGERRHLGVRSGKSHWISLGGRKSSSNDCSPQRKRITLVDGWPDICSTMTSRETTVPETQVPVHKRWLSKKKKKKVPNHFLPKNKQGHNYSYRDTKL